MENVLAKAVTFVSEYLKAFTAAMTSGGATFVALGSDGSMSASDWIAVLVAAVVAWGAVSQVPNAPQPPAPDEPVV